MWHVTTHSHTTHSRQKHDEAMVAFGSLTRSGRCRFHFISIAINKQRQRAYRRREKIFLKLKLCLSKPKQRRQKMKRREMARSESNRMTKLHWNKWINNCIAREWLCKRQITCAEFIAIKMLKSKCYERMKYISIKWMSIVNRRNEWMSKATRYFSVQNVFFYRFRLSHCDSCIYFMLKHFYRTLFIQLTYVLNIVYMEIRKNFHLEQ